MKIDRIYITHTVGCSGWNLDSIFENTIFRKAIHTHQRWEKGVKMLDWDFKRPDPERHINLAKNHDFEVIMAPDIWDEKDKTFVFWMVEKLEKYAPRVVIPIHYYDEDLANYELAYPNAKKFNPNARNGLGLIHEYKNYVTHILGGSPHSQLKIAKYFPNLKSVDGNLIFWCAVHYGEYWDWGWKNPEKPMKNEEIFKISIKNVARVFSGMNEKGLNMR